MNVAAHPEPILSVHFIECGQGNMTVLVTPSRTIVYDCRITEEEASRITDHLKAYIPQRRRGDDTKRWIDWFICSHRDRDHIHGLDLLNADFPIRGIVDPGTTSGSTEGAENQYYMRLRRTVKDTYGDGALIVPTPSSTPLFDYDGVKFYCLCSGKDDPPSEDGHYGNNVFQVECAGNRILLTGDSDWRAWKERIVPKFTGMSLLSATVLVASHHGSRSFFMDSDQKTDEEEKEAWGSAYFKHLELIAPKMTVISCGDQAIHNHPNPTALRKYRERTSNEQVYLTRDLGTLIGQFHSNGWWTVTPSRFLNGWLHANRCTPGKVIKVKCIAHQNGTPWKAVNSGEQLPIGCKLKFEVEITGLPAATSMTDYTFEVSNGGVGKHDAHDEIYSEDQSGKGRPNTFERDLSYEGLHLLRCHVRSPFLNGQHIFEVRGIAK